MRKTSWLSSVAAILVKILGDWRNRRPSGSIAALEQIQISLGHASIQTTERYLSIEQNLTDAPCDDLGLRV